VHGTIAALVERDAELGHIKTTNVNRRASLHSTIAPVGKGRDGVGAVAMAAAAAAATATQSARVAEVLKVQESRKEPLIQGRKKMEAKRFEAKLSSFQDLVNSENTPLPIHEALDRLKPLAAGSNFVWDRHAEWGVGYGGALSLTYKLILWYHNWDRTDTKTTVNTNISFLSKPSCCFVYQPVVPVTSLAISPGRSFRPMFELDPRSFHTFKLAWRHFLDCGVADYRIIVGEQLDKWTQRCKAIIEKPFNSVYWLMLMVGSYYRENLAERQVLHAFEEPFERIAVICVDSFVSLSALLFSPERQVLYAGMDPTPSYLQWLQYIGDQLSTRKEIRQDKPAMVFERNEQLDLAVVIVFYGRVQHKVKENTPLSWTSNPSLVRSYIHKYAEDNRCGTQLEQAVRLYAHSCSVGEYRAPAGSRKAATEDPWFCWNGMKVCEVGVPMPCTQASFLAPFVTMQPMALLCPLHGPDAAALAALDSREEEKTEKHQRHTQGDRATQGSLARSGRQSSQVSNRQSRGFSIASGLSRESADAESQSLGTHSARDSGIEDSETDAMTCDSEVEEGSTAAGRSNRRCLCGRYLRAEVLRRKGRKKGTTQPSRDQDGMGIKALGAYDLLHAGGHPRRWPQPCETRASDAF
jgi:hypothetical protein